MRGKNKNLFYFGFNCKIGNSAILSVYHLFIDDVLQYADGNAND